ncbi:hypothetical protein HPULCUR_000230 [Helicostylum pulchrum]|uniref:VASt domain-containing protein n=1 Tax=Helicostylum pulchrum TaxID=562976 RepID=A0ABP9XJ96_9FUNG
MSDKNLTLSSSSHLLHRQANDSDLISSTTSLPLVKRKFSAAKMLNKAKDSTISLVKRHSLEAKRSPDENLTVRPGLEEDKRSSSLTSLEQLRVPSNESLQTDDSTITKILSARKKHYSLPIKRPFTIKKDSADSSLSSFTTTSSTAPAAASTESSAAAAAAAEADILSGTERPGSFATACDFRLAKDKRNEEFHALFKSVRENDLLIQDYKCALSKDILLQGHLFISEHHVCFKSNIFGWVTNLVINFDEITQVEKKMTARIIPNGITIETSTSKHVFASFLLRDQAYDQMVKIWDLSKKVSSVIPTSFDEDDNNSLYGDTEDEDSLNSDDSAILLSDPSSLTQVKKELTVPVASVKPALTPDSTTIKDTPTTKLRPRSVSDSNYRGRRELAIQPESSLKREITFPSDITPIKKTRVCPCTVRGEQYSRIAINETFPGTVEAMFRLLFDSSFVKGFLERYENFENVQTSVWQHGAREVVAQRRIKSTTSGTKVVKTLFQEKRIHRKYPYYACVTTKKSMPNMPMGAVYNIELRTCITRVSKDKVHLLVTFQIVFSKSGLVSSIIEKNAADDQIRLYSHLNSILNKPYLVQELVDNVQLLQDLDLNDKDIPKQIPEKNSKKDRKPFLVVVYICFFLILLTHCIMALRLKNITHHLALVPHKPQYKDLHWVDQNMDRVHHQLNQIQGETQEYHQRIQKLNSLQ